MMTTIRDRENHLSTLQAGGKGQFAKTPGGKQNENGAAPMPLGGKGAFKVQADAFKTPMGPRSSRVPLGGKDTNIKAKTTLTFNDPLQTQKPGRAPPSSTKQTTRNRRQARLSITAAKAITHDEEDYPEIEYIPPAPKELPDEPEDYVRTDLSGIKHNLFRDVNSTPMWNAKQRSQFNKLTERDEKKEEEDVLKELDAIIMNMKIGNEDENLDENRAVKKKPSSYSVATKSSLAKKTPSRPPSAASIRSAGSSTTVKPKPPKPRVDPKRLKPYFIPGPDGPIECRARPATGRVHPIGKYGDYRCTMTRKVGEIYFDQYRQNMARVNAGECKLEDIDWAQMEEDVLDESEKLVTPKYDFEKKMRDLFRMDEEEDEVYQIPLDD